MPLVASELSVGRIVTVIDWAFVANFAVSEPSTGREFFWAGHADIWPILSVRRAGWVTLEVGRRRVLRAGCQAAAVGRARVRQRAQGSGRVRIAPRENVGILLHLHLQEPIYSD